MRLKGNQAIHQQSPVTMGPQFAQHVCTATAKDYLSNSSADYLHIHAVVVYVDHQWRFLPEDLKGSLSEFLCLPIGDVASMDEHTAHYSQLVGGR